MQEPDSLPLRSVTRAELDQFYSEAETLYNGYQFACDENPAYLAIDWNQLDDPEYQRLTRSQKTLNNLTILDGQVCNGGLVQLFFNYGDEIEHISAAVTHLGWQELTTRFEAKYAEAFVSPDKAGTLEALNDKFQDGVREKPWEEAVKGFQQAYEEFDFEDFDDWWYDKNTQKQARDAVVSFIRANEADLFSIAG